MQVLILLFLAPVGAEYLAGYDTSTGRPLELLAGLLILGPLYGAPAVLIREVARRRGTGWPGVAALALAAGVLQAGVIDQALFSRSYRDMGFWSAMVEPTWIGALGLGGYPALNFLAGHAIWSFCAPIALAEAVRPERAHRPWLRRRGLVVVTLLYLAAAALILAEHLTTEREHASPAQLAGALLTVALLVLFGSRRRDIAGRQPPRGGWLVLIGLAAGTADLAPTTWAGFAVALAVLVAGCAGLARLRCTARDAAALATGAFVARAAVGFLVTPLGDVPAAAKYAHNTFFLAGAALLGWWLLRRSDLPVPAGHHAGDQLGHDQQHHQGERDAPAAGGVVQHTHQDRAGDGDQIADALGEGGQPDHRGGAAAAQRDHGQRQREGAVDDAQQHGPEPGGGGR
jgi:hypothetical protein